VASAVKLPERSRRPKRKAASVAEPRKEAATPFAPLARGFFSFSIDGGAVQAFYSLDKRKFVAPVAVKCLDIGSAVVLYRLRPGARYICFDYWERDTEKPPRHLTVAQFVVDPEEPPPHIRWEKSFTVAFYNDSFLAQFPEQVRDFVAAFRLSSPLSRFLATQKPPLPDFGKVYSKGEHAKLLQLIERGGYYKEARGGG